MGPLCPAKLLVVGELWLETDGEVVVARAVHDAFTAELCAMEGPFNLSVELGVIRAEFETDAQLLAMALNNRRVDFSSEAVIIEDLNRAGRGSPHAPSSSASDLQTPLLMLWHKLEISVM